MSLPYDRRHWTDPRDGQSYVIHCNFGRQAPRSLENRPRDSSERWLVFFSPEQGPMLEAAVEGSVDVPDLTDAELQDLLGRAQ